MRCTLTLVLMPAISLSLAAQAVGGIQGKITDKAGKPIPGVTVTLLRVGTNVTKEIKSNENGKYFLAGLDATGYEMTYKAEGYATLKMMNRIQIGGILTQDATLLTLEQVLAENVKNDPEAAAIAAANAGAIAFNTAGPLYSAQKFTEALPLLEKAYASYQESIGKTKDEKAKVAAETAMVTVQRVYGVTLFEVGKTDEVGKVELWKKSEGLLTEVLPKVPEANLLLIAKALLIMAEDRKDEVSASKYRPIVDKLEPPNPAVDYNKAVDAVNEGKFTEAKSYLDRTLVKDPKYPKAYYLMGVVEYSNGNMKAAKTCLLKYLELAPTGEKASDVKAMLEDPSLKRIK